MSIVKGPLNETPIGAGLALDELEEHGYIKESFPLHDVNELSDLYQSWMVWVVSFWDTPVSRIRAYFGGRVVVLYRGACRLVPLTRSAVTRAEKVALYAAFLCTCPLFASLAYCSC